MCRREVFTLRWSVGNFGKQRLLCGRDCGRASFRASQSLLARSGASACEAGESRARPPPEVSAGRRATRGRRQQCRQPEARPEVNNTGLYTPDRSSAVVCIQRPKGALRMKPRVT